MTINVNEIVYSWTAHVDLGRYNSQNALILSQTTNSVDYSKLKEFPDDNFKFESNDKVLRTSKKHCGKRRNCSLRAIPPFPTVFSKGLFPRGVNWCYCVGMG